MRMIESIDVGKVSSHDLWAEICPCPTDVQLASHAFADSFQCSPPESGAHQREFSNGEPREPLLNPQPWAPLQDSEVYLASLERRLQKVKGLSHEVTSKDMLRSLSQAKQECWDRCLQESFQSEAYIGDNDVDDSTLEHLKRWLQPEKVAITAEELQLLIPATSPSTAENKEGSDEQREPSTE
ncbi:Hypothetical predicted protein [Pelobates cultripes]|uniref:Coiled-coil domain containing 32 n=1 Tax=Pelobates cultripes TaxID=61616 RepID=A0AAD1R3U4_PELCU|nr:Hypothetical predicted protein [Pelobates cultripes]